MFSFIVFSFVCLFFSFSYMVTLLFLEKNYIVSESLKVHFAFLSLFSAPQYYVMNLKEWLSQLWSWETGLLFIFYVGIFTHSNLIFVHDGWIMALFFLCVETILAKIIVIDARLMIIPDFMTWLGIGVVLIFAFLFSSLSSFWSQGACFFIPMFFGGGLGFCLFFALWLWGYLLTGRAGLGWGDLKLFIFVGLLLGIQGVLNALMIGSLLSLSYFIYCRLFLKKKQREMPFAPGFCLATLFLMYYYSIFLEHFTLY